MSLLRSAMATPLRSSLRKTVSPRISAVAGPSNLDSLCRSFASTSLRSAGPDQDKKATSTYTAILDSLTESLEKNGHSSRLTRPSDGRRNYVEDLEAEWATRALYGDPSWPATPYSGRSIAVNAANDVSRAYSQLNSLLARNNVRRELRLVDRFEKPNRERNRKKSERHRRRFADLVRKKVQLVMAIKARGA